MKQEISSSLELQEKVNLKCFLTEEIEHPNLFQYARQHFKTSRTVGSAIKYEAVMKDCTRRKYFFWSKVLHCRPETKEKEDSRIMVTKVSLFSS